MKSHVKDKHSLRGKIIFIVMISWVLPVLLVVGVTGYYTINNINDQIVNTITTYVNNSIQISSSNINSAIRDSRNASYYPSINDAYQKYKKNKDTTQLYDDISKFLNSTYKYDSKYLATMMFFTNKPDVIYYAYNDIHGQSYDEVIKYQKTLHDEIVSLSDNLLSDIKFIYRDNNLFMVRNLLDANFKPYAVIVMNLNINEIFGSLNNILYQTDITIFLDETPVLISGDTIDLNEYADLIPKNNNVFTKESNNSVIYGSKMTDGGLLSYVIKLDKKQLLHELVTFNRVLLCMVILIIPLLIVAIWFFHKNVNKPTAKLLKASRHLENGNFGYQLESSFKNKEFECLRDSFNQMSLKLEHQFNTIYSEELALRDARIMALQSQINPHFLNNTLEIINWEARLSDNIKVSRMIESLSTMLDAAMDRNGKPLVTLTKELMYVDAYLYIISERLGDKISITKEIDETLLECLVPRLVLQPIIENAVEHGVTYEDQRVVILKIYKENNLLIIDVKNSGDLTAVGEEKIKQLLSFEYGAKTKSSGNVGIYNVNQRLKMLYGKNSGLSIKNCGDHFIITRIVIPI